MQADSETLKPTSLRLEHAACTEYRVGFRGLMATKPLPTLLPHSSEASSYSMRQDPEEYEWNFDVQRQQSLGDKQVDPLTVILHAHELSLVPSKFNTEI